jgi:hypothetical protein
MKNKIIAAIPILILVVATITLVVMRGNESDEENYSFKSTEIDYEEYFKRRSLVFEEDTFALLIWQSDDEFSKEFLEEIEAAFYGRDANIYKLDVLNMEAEIFSRVIDDVTALMGHEEPKITIPTLIIMSGGEALFVREGLMLRWELIENLNYRNRG